MVTSLIPGKATIFRPIQFDQNSWLYNVTYIYNYIYIYIPIICPSCICWFISCFSPIIPPAYIYIYISIHIIAGDLSCYIMLSPLLVICNVISPLTTHLWLVNSPFFQHTESQVPCRVALLSLSWSRVGASVCRTGMNMEKRQQEAMMVSSWDLMVIYRDGMWFHGDLMGIYRDLMGFNGIYRDIMG